MQFTGRQWFGIIAGIFLAWFLLGSLPFMLPGSCDFTRAGTFGDSFGVANSFFGAAGFVALLFTLWLQRAGLQDAMNAQTEQAKHQTEMLMVQNDQVAMQMQLIQLQSKQIETAQLAARAQACSFLADLHYRMMEGA